MAARPSRDFKEADAGHPAVVLRFEDVSLRFDDVVALDQVSFEMPAGETRVILGAAGSGKTSLLKTAIGLIKPDSGHVHLLGRDITDLVERELFDIRSRVGVLFQEGGLFDSMTVSENVSYPLVNQRAGQARVADVDGKVRNALRFVELEHTLDKFPSELSGGMRRRVGIARAVVTEPPLVLYDSPTAGLDPITANTIMALIAKERDTENTANVIVTHRYQDGQLMANFRYNPQSGHLERASRNGSHGGESKSTVFMVMKDGRLVFEGAQDELESSHDDYVSKFVLRRQ
jgi:phospholipid/cholesterol/gamma-HCH transport system ATP-binding protein